MGLFDDLLAQVKRYRDDKPVLFIIDDLDKIQATPVQQEVFNLQLPMLLRPDCAALYTFPLELHHDARFSRLKNEQANYYVLANVKLTEYRGGALLPEGRRVMGRFVSARLSGEPIETYLDLGRRSSTDSCGTAAATFGSCAGFCSTRCRPRRC